MTVFTCLKFTSGFKSMLTFGLVKSADTLNVFSVRWLLECLYINVAVPISAACTAYISKFIFCYYWCAFVCTEVLKVNFTFTFWCFLMCEMRCVSLENIRGRCFLLTDFNSALFLLLCSLSLFLSLCWLD